LTSRLPEQALQAQVLGEAQLQQAQINLDYTEIRAPIDGRSRTAVTRATCQPQHRCPRLDRQPDPMFVSSRSDPHRE
jgi:hypothetical protein